VIRPRRNGPLGALFVVLALALAGIAVAALRAEVWVIAFAAAVLALWLGSLAARLLSAR
jgi:cobalamin synthase